MRTTGHVSKASAVKAAALIFEMGDLDRLVCELAGTLRGLVRDEGRHESLVLDTFVGESDVVQRFGPTDRCKQCRCLVSGDKTYYYVQTEYPFECVTGDETFRHRVEEADLDQTQRLADLLHSAVVEGSSSSQLAGGPGQPTRSREGSGATGYVWRCTTGTLLGN